MESKQKPSSPKNKSGNKHTEVSFTHEVRPKIQTAEGWKRSMLKELKKKKS
jgi:hypothetical protein